MANRRDVAKRAGVSPSTVSRVLGGYRNVSPRIAARVIEAADALGYRPNLAARSLKTKRSQRIGVIVHQVNNPYYAEIIEGIEEVAKNEGYVVSVCALSSRSDFPAVDKFLDQQFDGVIVAFATKWDIFHQTRLYTQALNGMPVVFSGAPPDSPPGDQPYISLIYDWRGAAEAAVSYLLDMGHEKIAFISSLALDGENLKYQGFCCALRSRGMALDEQLLVSTAPIDGFEAGRKGVETLLFRGVHPTAIFAYNDTVAIGAIAALTDAGYSVPDDVSIVGHDDITVASFTRPGLSTVRVPKAEQGRLSCQILIRASRGEAVQKTWMLQGALAIRQTTRRVPG